MKRISRHKNEIKYSDPMYRRLQELEDKLESGQLVELPHKVGDKVYLVRRNRNYELVVSRTKIEMYLYHWKLLVKCSCDSSWHEPQDIFSDKEQAEARLKRVIGGSGMKTLKDFNEWLEHN